MARTVIAIPTRRRPAQLAALLDSLSGSVPESGLPGSQARILVIDNDPARSAAGVVARACLPVDYVAAPEPGLAAVRNRALDEARDEDFLVFVDDDELVDAGWYDALVRHAATSGADVVTGPVLAELPGDAPRWIVRGRFIQRPRFPSGHVLTTAWSNNTLLRLETWRRLGSPRFDPAFSEMGGEDTDFFGRLGQRGARIEFCDEAVAREPVTGERLTLRWVTHRSFAAGVIDGVLRARRQSGLRIIANGLAAGAVGLATMALQVVTLRGVQVGSFERVLGAAGRIASLAGVRTRGYAAPADGVSAGEQGSA